MSNKETWKINKSADFTEIETTDIYVEVDKDANAIAIKKDTEQAFICKPMSTFKFLFKRYPFMIVPTIILSLVFLWLHTIAFFIYTILTLLIFTMAVRFCAVKSIGTYIMVFWILHLLGNFFILSGGLMSTFTLAMTERHNYIQSLFFGMLLMHIWIYVLIFLQQYYHVYNITNEEDGEQVDTQWYIWKGCSFCNRSYNPFTDNCGEK